MYAADRCHVFMSEQYNEIKLHQLPMFLFSMAPFAPALK